MSGEGEMSKSAKKRAAKKARDAAGAEAEVEAPPPAPEPKAKAKAKAKAAPAPEPEPPAPEPKAKAKGKAKAKAAPEPEPPAPEPKAKAKGKAKAEPKAAPAPEPKAEPKAQAKAQPKAKSQPAAAKAKAKAQPVEEEEAPVKQKEELINYFIDDGSGGAWEVNTGLSKKNQRRKERAEEEQAAYKASGIKPGVPQNYVPGMGPVGGSAQGGPKSSQSLAAAQADVQKILAMKGEAEAEKPAPGAVSSATVHVPEKRIGIVIGPKGDKIKMIQEKTGAKIDTTGEIFTITGPPQAVSQAENAVRELCDKGYCALQYEDFSENFVNVHPSYFPDLIGKGGVIIREIKDKLGVEVSIPQTGPSPPIGKKFKVGLAGSTASVEKAKTLINEIMMYGHSEITHPGMTHVEMDIDPWAYRYLIGTKGSEMKHIQHNWKVKVVIPRDHSVNQKVLIVGEEDQVSRAQAYVEKVLWNAENQSKGRDRVDRESGDVWGDEEEEEDWMKQYIYKR